MNKSIRKKYHSKNKLQNLRKYNIRSLKKLNKPNRTKIKNKYLSGGSQPHQRHLAVAGGPGNYSEHSDAGESYDSVDAVQPQTYWLAQTKIKGSNLSLVSDYLEFKKGDIIKVYPNTTDSTSRASLHGQNGIINNNDFEYGFDPDAIDKILGDNSDLINVVKHYTGETENNKLQLFGERDEAHRLINEMITYILTELPGKDSVVISKDKFGELQSVLLGKGITTLQNIKFK